MPVLNPGFACEAMTEPFTWALVRELFPRPFLEALARGFPSDGFTAVAGHAPDKPYAMRHRSLLARGPVDVATARPGAGIWRDFAALVSAPAYRAFIQDWCPRPLAECDWEINWWSYDAGSWIAPHRDKPEKLVSHIIYLNQGWQAAWGGCCRILASEDIEDVRAEIVPDIERSLLIVRSESSWHAVTPVTVGDRLRNSVQVVVWARS